MKPRHWAFGLAIPLTLIAQPARTQQPVPNGLPQWELEPSENFDEGTIDGKPIGFRFVLDKAKLKSATYYVGPDWKERPLRIVEERDGGVVLEDPAAGIFRLHFYGDGDLPADDWFTSLGLIGSYQTAATQLPVKMHGAWFRRNNIGGRLYVAGAADDVVEARAISFLQAAIANRPLDAAKAVSFPMNVGWCGITIRNKTQLISHWPSIFTEAFRNHLKLAVPRNMFVDPKSLNAMVLSGVVWFDERGATDVRPLKCPTTRKK